MGMAKARPNKTARFEPIRAWKPSNANGLLGSNYS
jgi:hypothetical protein